MKIERLFYGSINALRNKEANEKRNEKNKLKIKKRLKQIQIVCGYEFWDDPEILEFKYAKLKPQEYETLTNEEIINL